MLSGLATLVLAQTSGEYISLTVDGQTRQALVFRPKVKPKGKPAVYFVFHGLGGSAKGSEMQFRIHELDPSAIVIYGQALPSRLEGRASGLRNLAQRSMWQIMPGQDSDRDLHYVEWLLAWAGKAGCDASKRYCMGHSNGSLFTWVVLSKLGDQFSRFVGLEGAAAFRVERLALKPVFITSGSDDRIATPGPIQKFANEIAKNNRCSAGVGDPLRVYSGANPVYLYFYKGGHMPPRKVYETAVKFCRTGRV